MPSKRSSFEAVYLAVKMRCFTIVSRTFNLIAPALRLPVILGRLASINIRWRNLSARGTPVRYHHLNGISSFTTTSASALCCYGCRISVVAIQRSALVMSRIYERKLTKNRGWPIPSPRTCSEMLTQSIKYTICKKIHNIKKYIQLEMRGKA